MKDGGKIYAEFTTSRIVRALASEEPLSEYQRRQIQEVLLAEQNDQKHSLDLRLFIPLVFRNYYITLFAGRDRRRSTLELHNLRWLRTSRGILRTLSVLALVLLSFLMAIAAFWGLYKLKSALGIDIFPGIHLSDLLSEWFAID